MGFLVFRRDGQVFYHLHGETLPSAEMHVRNGFPDLVADYEAGRITVEEVESAVGIPELEQWWDARQAREQAEVNQKAIARKIEKALFIIVNEIRGLKGQGLLTAEGFRGWVETL